MSPLSSLSRTLLRFSFGLSPLLLGACSFGNGVEVPTQAGHDIYGLQVQSLEGDAVALSQYRGQVALVVNTASKCGFTPQYEGLQTLYDRYQDQGFVVLGFPCNDFMGQEPGTAAEIRAFCTQEFGVTFPMFEKVSVKAGEEQSELYRTLGAATGTLPSWNFGKYLIGRDGQVEQFFGTRVAPSDADLIAAIEDALAAPLSSSQAGPASAQALAASVVRTSPVIELASDYADFPATTEFDGKTLQLNGAALCEWGLLGFNLYRGALYVERPSRDAETLLQVDQTMLVHLHFVRKLSAAQLQDAFRASVHYQVGAASPLESELQSLLSWMVDVRKGDAMSFVVDSNKHLIGFVNGAPMGKIESPEFGELFVRLYLGNKPPTEALKRTSLARRAWLFRPVGASERSFRIKPGTFLAGRRKPGWLRK